MKAFHFAGDTDYIHDALGEHCAQEHGVGVGDVRGCKPLGSVSHCVAQASERHEPSEAAGILGKADRHVLTLRVALAAAVAMLADARAAARVDDDGVADPRLGEGTARGPLGDGDPRTGDGPKSGGVEDPRTGEIDGTPDGPQYLVTGGQPPFTDEDKEAPKEAPPVEEGAGE